MIWSIVKLIFWQVWRYRGIAIDVVERIALETENKTDDELIQYLNASGIRIEGAGAKEIKHLLLDVAERMIIKRLLVRGINTNNIAIRSIAQVAYDNFMRR